MESKRKCIRINLASSRYLHTFSIHNFLKVANQSFTQSRVISSFFDKTSIMVTLRLLLLEVRKIFDLRTEIINC